MNRSEKIGEIAKALIKAQMAIRGALKDSKNPHFKSEYANLESVIDACRKPLADNDLAYTQGISVDNASGPVLITMLIHAPSEQWLSSAQPIITVKAGPQDFGSAQTYARRYALKAILGMPDLDDDGETAMGRYEENLRIINGQDSAPHSVEKSTKPLHGAPNNCPKCGKPMMKDKFKEGKFYCVNCNRK